MEFIQSKDNKTIKHIIALGQRKNRQKVVNILLRVSALYVILQLWVQSKQLLFVSLKDKIKMY